MELQVQAIVQKTQKPHHLEIVMNFLRQMALAWNKILNFGRRRKTTNLSLVDIGASYFLHKPWIPLIISQSAKLIAVDPNSENLNYLDTLKSAKIEKLGVALASEEGTRVLYVTNVDSGSSIFPPKPSREDLLRSPGLESYLFPVRDVPIEVTTLDKVLESKSDYYALKIDTQGAELEILSGAKEALKNRKILSVELEVSLLTSPIMAGTPDLASILKFLTSHDLELIWLRPTTPFRNNFKNQRRQTEADALFVLRKEYVLGQGMACFEAYEAMLQAYGLGQELQVLRALMDEQH